MKEPVSMPFFPEGHPYAGKPLVVKTVEQQILEVLVEIRELLRDEKAPSRRKSK